MFACLATFSGQAQERKLFKKNTKIDYKPNSSLYQDKTAKKDDLADCFLQGIYYLKKQNIINYSEDLKIKSV